MTTNKSTPMITKQQKKCSFIGAPKNLLIISNIIFVCNVEHGRQELIKNKIKLKPRTPDACVFVREALVKFSATVKIFRKVW
jgi:hypothetical protein